MALVNIWSFAAKNWSCKRTKQSRDASTGRGIDEVNLPTLEIKVFWNPNFGTPLVRKRLCSLLSFRTHLRDVCVQMVLMIVQTTLFLQTRGLWQRFCIEKMHVDYDGWRWYTFRGRPEEAPFHDPDVLDQVTMFCCPCPPLWKVILLWRNQKETKIQYNFTIVTFACPVVFAFVVPGVFEFTTWDQKVAMLGYTDARRGRDNSRNGNRQPSLRLHDFPLAIFDPMSYDSWWYKCHA